MWMSAMMSQQTWREVAKVSPMGTLWEVENLKWICFLGWALTPPTRCSPFSRPCYLPANQEIILEALCRRKWNSEFDFYMAFKTGLPLFLRCPLKSQTRSISKKRESRPWHFDVDGLLGLGPLLPLRNGFPRTSCQAKPPPLLSTMECLI